MAAINDLIRQIEDRNLRERLQQEVERLSRQKKFGLVFEEHVPECTPLYGVAIRKGSLVAVKGGDIRDVYLVTALSDGTAEIVSKATGEKSGRPLETLVAVAQFGEPIFPSLIPIGSVTNAPDSSLWHTLIEADNFHALQLLEYLYPKQVDCIYIDPPYNTGAKDWKYNNDYVDSADSYRHSKWLSMMQKRLKIAKRLLNPENSVLIVTIDEKEYLHLGCLLEEMFPDANIQMISSCIMPGGVSRGNEFSRSDEYIFFLKIGNAAPMALQLGDEWLGGVKKTSRAKVHWEGLLRTGTNNMRSDRPNLFYPVFVSKDGKKFIGAGEPLKLNENRDSYPVPKGVIAVWPIHTDNSEGCWRIGRETLLELQKNHVVKLGGLTSRGMAINYLKQGEYSKVLNGIYKIQGINEDNSYILDDSDYKPSFIPSTQWVIPSHDASRHGSGMLRKIFGDKAFSFPKSLYAVHDAIRFFVANKPNALIIDFFAGSGTTLHAVNLLNAEDGGHRRCILVTNNEVSADEAKTLAEQGYQPGDDEWEKFGIARYVTWPRTVCSIEGHDVSGNPLKGEYLGTEIPMSGGFAANAEYFKLGFLDKGSVALGQQFRGILPMLWLKAGAVGKRPVLADGELPCMLIPDGSNFAVLIDERHFGEFLAQIEARPEIEHVYLVTNSEDAYREMGARIHARKVTQLYRDYIDNFVINSRRI